jgi:site-specific DNA-methyltransferase (adenine-specific)
MMLNSVHHASACDLLDSLENESIDMIYTDPPFGTGDVQVMSRKKAGAVVSKIEYSDKFSNYMEFLEPHLWAMHRVLKESGTMYLHMDWRWVHYAKVKCDEIFGYNNFLNEVIWSYNFGGRAKNRWPQKHDTILVYAKAVGKHTFNWNDIDRIPYTAPALQYVGRTKEEAEARIAEGQVPTDVWNMSIVGTASKERLGYPNQKPLKLIKRAIMASSRSGDVILDPFAGSGSTAFAALETNRKFITSDVNDESIAVMKKRFSEKDVVFVDSELGEKNG